MSVAMKLIVDGYIRLKDRKTLEALGENWRQMRNRLEEASKSGLGVGPAIQQYDKEILAKEQGLRALDNPAADALRS